MRRCADLVLNGSRSAPARSPHVAVSGDLLDNVFSPASTALPDGGSISASPAATPPLGLQPLSRTTAHPCSCRSWSCRTKLRWARGSPQHAPGTLFQQVERHAPAYKEDLRPNGIAISEWHRRAGPKHSPKAGCRRRGRRIEFGERLTRRKRGNRMTGSARLRSGPGGEPPWHAQISEPAALRAKSQLSPYQVAPRGFSPRR